MEVPEEIYQIGSDAMSAIWQVASRLMLVEANKIRDEFHHKETELAKKHQTALDKIDSLTKSIAELKQQLDLQARENKSLQVDLDRRIGEFSREQTHNERLEEKLLSQEHEAKRLLEDLTRTKEQMDYQHRRLEDVLRQTKLDEQNIAKLKEELNNALRHKERLQEHNRILIIDNQSLQDELKIAQTQASGAIAALEENRVALKKAEQLTQDVKSESQIVREALEVEHKIRMEVEKKFALLQTQCDAQEFVHRDTMNKMEQDLSLHKSETQNLRARLIKTEGALEREKKAVERLETRLAVLAGGKNTMHS